MIRALLALVAVTAVAGVAVSSTHASVNRSAQDLTHAQLVKRAFAICAAASDGIAEVRPALSFPAASVALSEVLVHLRRVVVRLDALRPTGRDAPRLARYLTLMRRQNAALGRAQRAARRGDRTTFRAAYLDAGGFSLQARAAAERLGLAVCSTL